MTDFIRHPINLRQGFRWADRALKRTDLPAGERTFVEDIVPQLVSVRDLLAPYIPPERFAPTNREPLSKPDLSDEDLDALAAQAWVPTNAEWDRLMTAAG